jgi:hypothetical protein
LFFLFQVAREYLAEVALPAPRDSVAELAFLRAVASGSGRWSNAGIRQSPELFLEGLLAASGVKEDQPGALRETLRHRITAAVEAELPAKAAEGLESGELAELGQLLTKLHEHPPSALLANAHHRAVRRIAGVVRELHHALEQEEQIAAEAAAALSGAEEPAGEDFHSMGEEDEPALQRTEAQREAVLKVNEVSAQIDKQAQALVQLKRAASSIYRKASTAPAREALDRVKSLETKVRNFRCDAEEELVALDNLSLHDSDRPLRKENIASIENLLTDLESASANLHSTAVAVQKRVDEEEAAARIAAEESRATREASDAAERQEVMQSILAGMPTTEDWSSLSLEVRAAAHSTQDNYVISLPVAAAADSVRIDTDQRRHTVTVSGVVVPKTRQEWLELTKAVKRALNQITDVKQLEEIRSRGASAAWLAIASGRYGKFSSGVQLPEDALLEQTSGRLVEDGIAVTVPRMRTAGWGDRQRDYMGYPRRSEQFMGGLPGFW